MMMTRMTSKRAKLVLLLLSSALLVYLGVETQRPNGLFRNLGFALEDGTTNFRLLKTTDDAQVAGDSEVDKKSGDDADDAATSEKKSDTKKTDDDAQVASDSEVDKKSGGDADDAATSGKKSDSKKTDEETAADDDDGGDDTTSTTDAAGDDDSTDDDTTDKAKTTTNTTVSKGAVETFNQTDTVLDRNPYWVIIGLLVVALALCLLKAVQSCRQRRGYQEIPTSMVV